jgi:mRNA-degrading endonuclease RelE of RelBE toxin-antitoxin system
VLRAFDARPILEAVEELRDQAEVTSRNRRRLVGVIPGLPAAAWEIRIGDYRVFYEVRRGRIVRVLRVILKGRLTTRDAVHGSRDE